MHLGKAFSDSVRLGRGSRKLKAVEAAFSPAIHRRWRLFGLFVLLVVSFIFLCSRLFNLTIIHGARNRLLSEANRTRELSIQAPRGTLFDRNGEPLVENIPIYNRSSSCIEGQFCLDSLGSLAPIPGSSLVNVLVGRSYPLGSAGAHLIGTVGEINAEELTRLNADCPKSTYCHYRIGEWVGRGGAEEEYDESLRGISGRVLVEIDPLGKVLRVLGHAEPKKGDNITLSIDKNLQTLAASVLASRSGAIIISVPATGEVLALASSPSFDPNAFARGDPAVLDIMSQEDQPLFDRAIAGIYPPGSTFKIITSAAALEEGKITKDTLFEDVGVITIGPYSFPNWYFLQYGKKEGMVNIVKALARSNDIFFYRTGELIGIDTLATWARRFGVGKRLGIDLPGEEKGLVPDTLWKQTSLNEQWFLGDTYHVAIGQGNLLTTPLQVNAWTNVIASGGKLCRPHVKKDESKQATRENCQDVGLHKETMSLIREGMKQACASGGTGWPLFEFKVKNETLRLHSGQELKIDNEDFLETYESTASAATMVKIPIACKTGTAEYGDPKGKTHAWITAFAPVQNPQISVTVLIEGGGEGSSVAGPLAKKIFEYWFSK